MRKLNGVVWGLIGLSVLAASLILSSAPPGATKQDETNPPVGDRVVPVQVVNKDPINVALPPGPITVDIAGVPAVQVDSPDLKSALAVLDIREAARKPFAFWEEVNFESPSEGYNKQGKWHTTGDDWIVLNYANVVACAQPKEKISIRMLISYDYSKQGLGKGTRAIQIQLTEQGVFLEPEGLYMHVSGSQQMNLYIQPRQQFWFDVWRSGEGENHKVHGHAESAIWLSGYTVPAVQFEGAGGGIVR